MEVVTFKLLAALGALRFICKFKSRADEPSKGITSQRVLLSMFLI